MFIPYLQVRQELEEVLLRELELLPPNLLLLLQQYQKLNIQLLEHHQQNLLLLLLLDLLQPLLLLLDLLPQHQDQPQLPQHQNPAAAPAAKPAGSAMDQFAKANPKLAASAAERDRTRGTSATTNPLMKDMKSRLPAPKTPSPTTAKTGFDLAKKGVNLAAGFDMFDVVKGYLIGEGYADTEEAALVIMQI
jgi:hypothetical protein